MWKFLRKNEDIKIHKKNKNISPPVIIKLYIWKFSFKKYKICSFISTRILIKGVVYVSKIISPMFQSPLFILFY